MRIEKVVSVKYVGKEEVDGFEFDHEPIEDSLTIVETEDGFEARYLVQDEDPQSPNEWGDDGLFLVNYHRDFDVRRDKVITKDEVIDWYRGGEDKEDYWMFPLSCLVHSGVWLNLRHSFACDSQGWDTSHVGVVMVRKAEWPEKEKAVEAAKSYVKTWNCYLEGDVYGIIKETYDKDKQQVDNDSCWGFYGYKYALEALKTEI